MAHKSLAALFIIGGDMLRFHKGADGFGGAVGGLVLNETAVYGDDVMAAGTEKAVYRAVTNGINGLVAVIPYGITADDVSGFKLKSGDVLIGIVYPLKLEAKLSLIADVPEGAATALSVMGAIRLNAVGGGADESLTLAEYGGVCHLENANGPPFTGDRTGNKNRSAAYAADSGSLA